MKKRILVISPKDNVAIAIHDLRKGEILDPVDGSEPLRVLEDVPACHKIALRDLAKGETIRKYGEEIGLAAQAISRGEWIHTHNLGPGEGEE